MMHFTTDSDLIKSFMLDKEVLETSLNDNTRAMIGATDVAIPDDGFFCVSDDHMAMAYVSPTTTEDVYELHSIIKKEGRGRPKFYFQELIDLLVKFTSVANLITYVEVSNTRAYYSAKRVGFQEIGKLVAYSKNNGYHCDAILFQYPIEANLIKPVEQQDASLSVE